MKKRNETKSPDATIDRRLVALLLVAFALRLAWLWIGPQVMENEGGSYTKVAENLLQGRGFESIYGAPETMYTLMLPVLIAGAKLVIGGSDIAARVVMLLAGTALIAPIYLIARLVYSRDVAFIAGLFAAASPLLIGFSAAVYTETPFMLFVTAGCYFALLALERLALIDCSLAGLFWGLAYLTRPEGIAFVLLTIVAFALVAWVKRKPAMLALRASLVTAGVALLIAAPYVFYLWQHTGSLRLEGKNLVNYTIIKRMETGMSYNEAAWGIDADLDETGPLLEPTRYAAHTPYPLHATDVLHGISSHLAHNASELLQHELPSFAFGGLALWAAVALGWFRRSWDRDRLRRELFLIAAAGYLLLLLMLAHVVQFRYVVPLLPFLLIWAANGVRELADWARGTARTLALPDRGQLAAGWTAIGATLVCFVVIGVAGVRYLSEINEGFADNLVVKQGGLWLRERAPGPKKIMDVSSYVPYYAGGSLVGLPETSGDLALRYIEKVQPDFIVLWSPYSDHRRYLRDWLDRGIPSPYAERIYVGEENTESKKLVIYRWRHEARGGTTRVEQPNYQTAARTPRLGERAPDPRVHQRAAP